MYFRNPEQEIRKKNYARYKQMTARGFSIAEETTVHQLYVINEDPFGRAYYERPLGQSVKRDPVTGALYTVEEWATKEFIVDNKAQLINKASADLLLGKRLSVKWKEEDGVAEELDQWLEQLITRNKYLTAMYEAAIRNSSLGDQFYEAYMEDGLVKFRYINPYWVDIDHQGFEVNYYEIAWEFEEDPLPQAEREVRLFARRRKTEYAQKKTHYPGFIMKELYVREGRSWKPVAYGSYPENMIEVERALRSPHMQTFLEFDPWDPERNRESEDPRRIMVIVEYTGVDEPLLIHWPNYRMFDVYGVSDTGMIESLQNAMNNRETQLNDVLDKHADPSMYGDASFLDEYGNLTMSGGGSRYFPVDAQGTPPGYLVWDSHLQESQDEIKRLYEAICMNTEISPALLGKDEGGIESGRALMYKLIRSLAMKTRKEAYMNQAIVDMIRIGQKLRAVWGEATEDNPPQIEAAPRTDWEDEIYEPNIEVQSALPTDVRDIIEQVTKLVIGGVLTKATALDIVEKYFDEIDVEQEAVRLAAERSLAAEDEQRRAQDFLRGME
jgi:hypothetical protein